MKKLIPLLVRSLVSSSLPSQISSTSSELLQKISTNLWPKFEKWMSSYEEFIGIKQVKEAHSRVLEAETQFILAQEERRLAQVQMNEMQVRLREVRADLDRTPRGDYNYLELIKREIELIRDERNLRDSFEREEKRERELFSTLSNALRFSHEKERAQNEKTKYWSLFASILGAFVGIVGTTINSQLRLRKLRELMIENTELSSLTIINKINELSTVGTSSKLSSTLLEEIKNIQKSSINSNYPQETIISELRQEGIKRERELLAATLSLLLLLPLIIKLVSN